MDVPGAIIILTVQGATRVSLKGDRCNSEHKAGMCYSSITASLHTNLAHIAASHHSISSSANHVIGDQAAPPVIPGAHRVADHRQEGLLQDVSNRTSSCRRKQLRFADEVKAELIPKLGFLIPLLILKNISWIKI